MQDDAIDRAEAMTEIMMFAGNVKPDEEDIYIKVSDAVQLLRELPSVTQKSGKWDRLYSWLNDMRLGIAPDETVDDIDERHCRESQTHILDEIMEWMIKAESEDKGE